MAGPTLSRFLGLFRLRDATNPTRMAAVSASGAVMTEGYTLDPQTGLPYDPTVAAPVVLPKSATATVSQTSVGTSATKLFNLNANATDRMVRCITVDMFIGPAGVTASTGFLVKAGSEPVRLPASVGEIYGITASGTATAYTFEQ